jgi:hypothetical protein
MCVWVLSEYFSTYVIKLDSNKLFVFQFQGKSTCVLNVKSSVIKSVCTLDK